MNRTEEYTALLHCLEATPEELDHVVEQAMKRETSLQKRRRLLGIPAGSLAACFAGFVLLVNLFPPFAMACRDIPVLGKLAQAVNWSPSLTVAVEHEFVQPVDETQTAGGVSATVHYLIVDRKQLNIFFSLDSGNDRKLGLDYHLDLPEDDQNGYASSLGDYGVPDGELRHLAVDFIDTAMPDALLLTLQVYDNSTAWGADAPTEDIANDPDEFLIEEETKPDYLATFTFSLHFDPAYTAQGEVIPVNQTFMLDDQSVTVREVEMYPTHLRLDLAYAPENTAWLTGLDFYLENENGERFDAVTNGISAVGDFETPALTSFWMDSPYFFQSSQLTLHIAGAAWLDKNSPRPRVDLAAQTGFDLPAGVRIEGAEKRGSNWLVSTSTPFRWGSTVMHSTWSGIYYDADGNSYSTDGHSSSNTPDISRPITGAELEDYERYAEANRDRYFESFLLKDYLETEVWLDSNWTRITTQDVPVVIPIL